MGLVEFESLSLVMAPTEAQSDSTALKRALKGLKGRVTRLSGDIGQLVGDTNNHRAVTAKKDQFDIALSNYLQGIEAYRLSLPLLDVAPQEFTQLDRRVQDAERSRDTVMELYNDYLTHCNVELSTINEGTQSHRSLLQSNRVSNVSRSRMGSVTSRRASRIEQQSHLALKVAATRL